MDQSARHITSAQSRAARALIGVSTGQLADLTVIPRVAIEEFEGGCAPLSDADFAALRQALERSGVVFIDEDGGGAGVRLRKHEGAS